MRAPVIYLEHGEAYGNLGDDAMLMCALDRLTEYVGDCRFRIPIQKGENFEWLSKKRIEFVAPIRSLILSEYDRFKEVDPWKTFEVLREELLSSVNGKKKPSWVRCLLESLADVDVAYFVGAANLNDFALRHCVIPKCLFLETCYRLKIPVVISSQTCAPLQERKTLDLVRKTLQRANFVSLRDRGVSLALLKPGWEGNSLMEIGDEAFRLAVAPDSQVFAQFKALGIERNVRPTVAFHFRATDYTKETECHFEKLVNLLDQIVGEWDADILALGLSYNPLLNDRELLDRLRAKVRRPERVFVFQSKDPTLVKGMVGHCYCAVGLSYHLHVFASSLHVPFLPLSSGPYYGAKLAGLLAWYGLEELLIDLGQESLDTIRQRLRSFRANYGGIREQLVAGNRRISEVNDLPAKAAREILSSSWARKTGGFISRLFGTIKPGATFIL
jgi:polysaccharide pyruvyl transferase WcaK-like protein